VRPVFVENHDSFSWNVIDRLPFPRERLGIVDGRDGEAVRGAVEEADALVIGPGPLDPLRVPALPEAVLRAAARGIPTLGICLGHQAIGVAFGARLVRAAPVHGKRSTIGFVESRFFGAFEGPLEVMRYHSLALAEVAAPLRVTAEADGLPMAVEHETLPIAGLQFHPDSFGTTCGEELLAAFFRAVA
jgi:anthranilate synthase/aminodeoxychorismate synthase-like glutamine amidotransferase